MTRPLTIYWGAQTHGNPFAKRERITFFILQHTICGMFFEKSLYFVALQKNKKILKKLQKNTCFFVTFIVYLSGTRGNRGEMRPYRSACRLHDMR